jgi:hypothetical protein
MITGNEVAVDNQLRRAEKQNQSPANRLIEGAALTAEAISLATGSVAIGSIARAFGIAKRFTSGLGVATLDENLDHLGDATEAALLRVERNLGAQGVRIDEIERRLNSSELLEGIKTATLQAQRTKNVKRLDRIALILANGVAEDDLEPESLDDMMRAAVELTEHDLNVLRSIYKMQIHLFSSREIEKEYVWRINEIHSLWEKWWKDQAYSSYQGINGMNLNGSFARLQSAGLTVSIGTTSILHGSTMHDYELLPAGKDFYERLQEIAVKQ